MLLKRQVIEDNRTLKVENKKLKEEIERLNNIINSIEKALKDNIEDLKEYSEMRSRVDEDKEILRFIQELKGSDKE